MKILITGTGGFLGSQITKRWEKSHQIFSINSRKDFASRLQQAKKEAPWDIVLHAGFHIDFSVVKEIELQSENIKNSTALIDAQIELGFSHFIFLSAAGIYGVSEIPEPRSESDFSQCDEKFRSYLQTRYIQEKIYVENILEQSGIPYTSLCPTTVYGPGMDSYVLQSLRKKSAVKTLPPGGTSFIYLDDFLRACDLAINNKPSGRLILNGANLLFTQLYQALHPKMKIISIPQSLFTPCKALFSLSKNQAILESSFGFKYYSSDRAKKALGWAPISGKDAFHKLAPLIVAGN